MCVEKGSPKGLSTICICKSFDSFLWFYNWIEILWSGSWTRNQNEWYIELYPLKDDEYEYDNSTSDDNYYEASESDYYSVEDNIDEDNVRIVDG